jgi:flagellar FliL protein
MSDIDTETPEEGAAPKKKGKKKLFVMLGALIVLGGGVGGGLYAAGVVGGGDHAEAKDDGKPKLVPKAEQKRVAAGEGGEGAAPASEGKVLPGADKYASNYYTFPKEFTSNLGDSDRFVQVGVAVSTHYDDTVIENIKTNEIAVRSAVLLALGDTTEDQIADEAGKKQLQKKLAAAINATLKEKEGFGGVGNVYFTNFVVQ